MGDRTSNICGAPPDSDASGATGETTKLIDDNFISAIPRNDNQKSSAQYNSEYYSNHISVQKVYNDVKKEPNNVEQEKSKSGRAGDNSILSNGEFSGPGLKREEKSKSIVGPEMRRENPAGAPPTTLDKISSATGHSGSLDFQKVDQDIPPVTHLKLINTKCIEVKRPEAIQDCPDPLPVQPQRSSEATSVSESVSPPQSLSNTKTDSARPKAEEQDNPHNIQPLPSTKHDQQNLDNTSYLKSVSETNKPVTKPECRLPPIAVNPISSVTTESLPSSAASGKLSLPEASPLSKQAQCASQLDLPEEQSAARPIPLAESPTAETSETGEMESAQNTTPKSCNKESEDAAQVFKTHQTRRSRDGGATSTLMTKTGERKGKTNEESPCMENEIRPDHVTGDKRDVEMSVTPSCDNEFKDHASSLTESRSETVTFQRQTGSGEKRREGATDMRVGNICNGTCQQSDVGPSLQSARAHMSTVLPMGSGAERSAAITDTEKGGLHCQPASQQLGAAPSLLSVSSPLVQTIVEQQSTPSCQPRSVSEHYASVETSPSLPSVRAGDPTPETNTRSSASQGTTLISPSSTSDTSSAVQQVSSVCGVPPSPLEPQTQAIAASALAPQGITLIASSSTPYTSSEAEVSAITSVITEPLPSSAAGGKLSLPEASPLSKQAQCASQLDLPEEQSAARPIPLAESPTAETSETDEMEPAQNTTPKSCNKENEDAAQVFKTHQTRRSRDGGATSTLMTKTGERKGKTNEESPCMENEIRPDHVTGDKRDVEMSVTPSCNNEFKDHASSLTESRSETVTFQRQTGSGEKRREGATDMRVGNICNGTCQQSDVGPSLQSARAHMSTVLPMGSGEERIAGITDSEERRHLCQRNSQQLGAAPSLLSVSSLHVQTIFEQQSTPSLQPHSMLEHHAGEETSPSLPSVTARDPTPEINTQTSASQETTLISPSSTSDISSAVQQVSSVCGVPPSPRESQTQTSAASDSQRKTLIAPSSIAHTSSETVNPIPSNITESHPPAAEGGTLSQPEASQVSTEVECTSELDLPEKQSAARPMPLAESKVAETSEADEVEPAENRTVKSCNKESEDAAQVLKTLQRRRSRDGGATSTLITKPGERKGKTNEESPRMEPKIHSDHVAEDKGAVEMSVTPSFDNEFEGHASSLTESRSETVTFQRQAGSGEIRREGATDMEVGNICDGTRQQSDVGPSLQSARAHVSTIVPMGSGEERNAGITESEERRHLCQPESQQLGAAPSLLSVSAPHVETIAEKQSTPSRQPHSMSEHHAGEETSPSLPSVTAWDSSPGTNTQTSASQGTTLISPSSTSDTSSAVQQVSSVCGVPPSPLGSRAQDTASSESSNRLGFTEQSSEPSMILGVRVRQRRIVPRQHGADISYEHLQHRRHHQQAVSPSVHVDARPPVIDLAHRAVDLAEVRDLPLGTFGDHSVRQGDRPREIRGIDDLRERSRRSMHSFISSSTGSDLPTSLRNILDQGLQQTLIELNRWGRVRSRSLCLVCNYRLVNVQIFQCHDRVLCVVCLLSLCPCVCPLCGESIDSYWVLR